MYGIFVLIIILLAFLYLIFFKKISNIKPDNITCNTIEKNINKVFENKHFKCKNNQFNVFTFQQINDKRFDLYIKDCYLNDNIIFDGFNRKLYSKDEMFDNSYIINNEDENKYNELCYLKYNDITISVSLRFFENREILIHINNKIKVNTIINSTHNKINNPILSIIFDISEIDELVYKLQIQKDELYKESIKKKIIDAEKKKELKREVVHELIDDGILIRERKNNNVQY